MIAKYRDKLPQLSQDLFLTDGGFETTLVFHEGFDLPAFAAFTLLKSKKGQTAMREYFDRYIPLATRNDLGFVLEAPTWRANPDWARKIGYRPEELHKANCEAVAFMEEIRHRYETEKTNMPISGSIGPRGDGYHPSTFMSVEAAERYHQVQMNTLKDTAADFVTSFTICYVEEAIGIVKAAKNVDMPVVIGFTLETDGRLPSGQSLKEAIERVDMETQMAPIYYMINCAHPTHFSHLFQTQDPWLTRVKGLRGNASCLSHAELNESETLDEGSPTLFGAELSDLKSLSPHITVLGGCCGTDY
ncbi:MAG: homocysteine S-methyltransferase family protein, partial [Nitrospirales bacterium]